MIERFDGAAVWAGLSPEAQAAIGATAVELAVARFAVIATDDLRFNAWESPERRAALAARWMLELQLTESVADVLPDDQMLSANGTPKVPSRLGPVCHGCGWSNHDAVSEDFEWAGADLCSACADRGLK